MESKSDEPRKLPQEGTVQSRSNSRRNFEEDVGSHSGLRQAKKVCDYFLSLLNKYTVTVTVTVMCYSSLQAVLVHCQQPCAQLSRITDIARRYVS
jgi:hypothetical protein